MQEFFNSLSSLFVIPAAFRADIPTLDPKPKITCGYDDESKQYVFSVYFSTLKCTTTEYIYFLEYLFS